MAQPGDEMAGARGRGRLLASDADRERVIDTLKTAFVHDLLTMDEFGLRVGHTLESRTYAELTAITAGIPSRLTGAPSPPKPAQGRVRAPGNAAVKSGLSTLAVLILWASTSAAAMSGSGAALTMALFLMSIGAVVAVIAALLAAGIRALEARDRKRSGGELPLRSSDGGGGRASRYPSSKASSRERATA